MRVARIWLFSWLALLHPLLASFALNFRQARSPQDAVTWVDALRTVCGKEHISVAGTAAVVASPDTRAEAATPAKPPRQVRR